MPLSTRLAWTPGAAPVLPLDRRQERALGRVLGRLSDGSYPVQDVPCCCGRTDGLVIATRNAHGLPLGLTLCPGCGLLRTSPGLSGEAAERFEIEDRDELCLGALPVEDLFRAQRAAGERILEDLRLLGLAPRRIHQVGCGTGGTLLPFAEAGMAVAGCDRRERLRHVDRAASLPLIEGGVEELVHAHGPADVLLLLHELEDWPDPIAGLRRIARAVVPGGVLVVQVAGVRGIVEACGGDLLAYSGDCRRWQFSAATLRWSLEWAGLEVEHVDETCMAVARVRTTDPQAAAPPPPVDEPTSVLRFLGEAEKGIALRGARVAPLPRRRAAPGPAASEPTVFFCIGCQKSGTTLLARVLDSHPQVACMSESWALRPRATPSIFNPASDKWRTHGFDPEDVRRWARNPRFDVAMSEALRDFARRCDARVVGDKWPWYIDYLDLVMEAFPAARFIYNVRDPRGLWNSAQRFRGRKRGDEVVAEMLAKDRRMEAHAQSDRFLTLRYEDLVTTPESTCRRIFEFLGVEWDPACLHYDESRDPYPDRWSWVEESTDPFDPRHTTNWRDQMTPEEIDRVVRRAGWFIEKYGYEP